MNGLVSIITPAYNSEDYIVETVNSVINQTYNNWELILVDDASTDTTLNLLNDIVNSDSRIQLHCLNTNSGAAVARNFGIDKAKGEYIAFLDSDDLWKPNKLQTQIAFMTSEGCDICFSDYELINHKGLQLGKRVIALPSVSYKKLLRSNYIGNLTGMYKAAAIGKVTTPNLRKRQDWLFWLLTLKKSGQVAKGINESLAFYRVHKKGISSNKSALLKYNYLVYKKGLGFSIVKSIICLGRFLFEHFFIKSKRVVTVKQT
ncbi:glycosyltransferase family 2 protein [Aestuariibaculum sediminum]|uniref:Glycosyltransferase family 2 protein n=1 Tax=Aestuariibaculum sediminum TaxID=2770637 RepID=A0A8J6Q6X2_9FLAO|nr:glycosyltransferase [Aestuariibaculum sediminum]MBD0831200.1 glycosyltransferase family 2 protein [Aestuariibaculum sediminum]